MGIAGDETTPKFSKAEIGFLFATVAKDSRISVGTVRSRATF